MFNIIKYTCFYIFVIGASFSVVHFFSNSDIEFTPTECVDETLLGMSVPTKNRRPRTKYTANQQRELEATFKVWKYPDHATKKHLAERLGLEEGLVSVSATNSAF